MHFYRNPFTCSHAKGEKSPNDFKFGTFTGCFPSDSATSTAVKGLNQIPRADLSYSVRRQWCLHRSGFPHPSGVVHGAGASKETRLGRAEHRALQLRHRPSQSQAVGLVGRGGGQHRTVQTGNHAGEWLGRQIKPKELMFIRQLTPSQNKQTKTTSSSLSSSPFQSSPLTMCHDQGHRNPYRSVMEWKFKSPPLRDASHARVTLPSLLTKS